MASELDAAQTPFVLVTLVSARGHVPQEPGAKAVVTREGLRAGTVGGGKIEARAIAMAKELLEGRDREPRLVKWNLQKDIGMTCGGEAQLLFEIHDGGGWQIAVFGAGHVAQALVRTLVTLDCRVVCSDPRPEWREKLPASPRLRAFASTEEAMAHSNESTFFVVMTQGHATDVPILTEIYQRFPRAPYVGVMGSAVKAKKMRQDLAANGVSARQLETLKCPIGFRIGGNTPAEISISVVSELLAERDSWRGNLYLAAGREKNAEPSDRDSEQALL